MSVADRFRHSIGDGTISPTFTNPNDDGYYALRVFRQPDIDDGNLLGSRHLGFDWNALSPSGAAGDGDIGEPIYAMANGEVVYTNETHPGFGKVIVVEHTLADGVVYSLYAHLDSIETTSGTVSIGEKIGELGRSGLGTGDFAHLHTEIFSVAEGASYLNYLTGGLPSRPGWFSYTSVSEASGAAYSSDTLVEASYTDGDFTWYNPFDFVEERLDPATSDDFPEDGVTETISFAEAADDFGVTDGSDVAELYLESVFGAVISNVTYTGSDDAAFLVSDFEIPGVDIDLEGGILLSSGGFPGSSNTSSGFTIEHGTAGDSDLLDVVQAAFPAAGATQDASVLQFDIFIDDPDVDGIRFDIIFGSEEYSEFSNSDFVDVAAVWIDDNRNGIFEVSENKALFNGNRSTPLSVIDQNLALNFVDNEGVVDESGNVEGAPYAIEWDGFGALAVRPSLQQGLNSIKIAVADTGDQALDSAIYVTNFELLTGGATGDDVFTVVNGAVGQNNLEASATNHEFNLAEGLGSVSGTLMELSGDVVTGFDNLKELIFQRNKLSSRTTQCVLWVSNFRSGQ